MTEVLAPGVPRSTDPSRAVPRSTSPAPDPGPDDERDPCSRLQRLFDPGSLDARTPVTAEPDAGVIAGRGRVHGIEVLAYVTDPRIKGGAMGSAGCAVVVAVIDRARRDGVPVVGLWHSGGARLAEGVASLDAVGHVFAAMVRASGVVPQVSLVLGAAAGGAAYGPALTDVVVMTPEARVFVTGPDVVAGVTGEQVDMAALGGPAVHAERSGVAHVVAEDTADAYRCTRSLLALLGDPAGPATMAGPDPAAPSRRRRRSGADTVDGSAPGCGEAGPDPAASLPTRRVRAYDVRPIVVALLDRAPPGCPALLELQPRWAPNVVTGLGRLGGATCGVIANNPLRKGGCLDSPSAEKAARFVRMCDQHGIPLLVVVDVPGYLPGVAQEWEGVVRRGAKLLHAFADAAVPRVTLITRKSYGGAYIAMNGRSLGATAVLAWPEAEIAVMGAEAAVGVLHRRELAAADDAQRPGLRARLAAEHTRRTGGVEHALALGVVDEVIEPAHTRDRLLNIFAAATPGRGRHRNIPL